MTQKILAAHAGLDSVKAGQLIEAKLDLVLGNDSGTGQASFSICAAKISLHKGANKKPLEPKPAKL